MTDPRYPIGEWLWKGSLNEAELKERISQLAEIPQNLRSTVRGFSDSQLDTPIRDGGWTTRQLVHHLADSHTMSFLRCKYIVTEENPLVLPFNQEGWVRTADSLNFPIEPSLTIVDNVHARWVQLLLSLKPEDFLRKYHVAEEERFLARLLDYYSWHGQHHTAQITTLRTQKGW